MFDRDNPLINGFCQRSPRNMRDMIIILGIGSQQQRFDAVVNTHGNAWRRLGLKAGFLTNAKKQEGAAFTLENQQEIYDKAISCLSLKGRTVVQLEDRKVHIDNIDLELMKVFLEIPQLGLAKAGFCCQLFTGRIGCIDVHNLNRLKIDPKVLEFDKSVKSEETRNKRIAAYVDACRKRKCRWLWDSWCNFLAKRWPNNWRDGDHVSLVHYECLLGGQL